MCQIFSACSHDVLTIDHISSLSWRLPSSISNTAPVICLSSVRTLSLRFVFESSFFLYSLGPRLYHIRNDDIRKERHTYTDFPGKTKNKVVWPQLDARTRPHLCEIAKTRSFWKKEQRLTEKETEGQRKGRHVEIPTN